MENNTKPEEEIDFDFDDDFLLDWDDTILKVDPLQAIPLLNTIPTPTQDIQNTQTLNSKNTATNNYVYTSSDQDQEGDEDDCMISSSDNDSNYDSGNESAPAKPTPNYQNSCNNINNVSPVNHQQYANVHSANTAYPAAAIVPLNNSGGHGGQLYNNNCSGYGCGYGGSAFREPAGLKEVDELARYSIEMVDTNAAGWNTPIFSSNIMDWAGPNQVSPSNPNPACSSCQVLRRIIHTNGLQDSKLDIHGIHGEPHHAVSECWFHHGDMPKDLNREIIQFPTRNPDHVRHFIAQYNLVRRKEGCILRYDSFMLTTDVGKSARMSNQTGFYNQNPFYTSKTNNYANGGKSSYSAQRQRTGKIQMSELARYFHLPIAEAAKQLRICPTVMKKICRKNGLSRWPHRKIKSIERHISSLEMSLKSGEQNTENVDSIKKQLDSLRNEQQTFYKKFL